jgi:hypothetical protein
MTSRTVSVPNEVVNGETSGRWSTRSSTASMRTGAAGRTIGMRSGYAARRAPHRDDVRRVVLSGAPQRAKRGAT